MPAPSIITVGIILVLTSLLPVKSQSALTIEIEGLKSNKGRVLVELFDKNEQTIKGVKTEIINKKCTIIFNDLVTGKYAVRFFHDENSNDIIDKNLLGIPKEGFGLSNDGLGKFGPKDFEEWLFPVSENTKITLITKYY